MDRPKKIVQPDYSKWQQIQVGMSYDAVRSILGDPQPQRPSPRTPGRMYYLRCGWVNVPGVPQPSSYQFTIGFDQNELVWMKSDPFDGDFSTDGIPARPRIIIPVEGTTFDHYPRILDIRWAPVSGVYPIAYEVEIAARSIDSPQSFRVVRTESSIPSPYYCLSYVGAGDARIRVRGSNTIGTGEWSDYRTFRFLR